MTKIRIILYIFKSEIKTKDKSESKNNFGSI